MDLEEKSVDFVQDVCKLLITLGTASVAFSVTFSKEIGTTLLPSAWQQWPWGLFCMVMVVSVACGIWTLLGLVTVLAPPSRAPSTNRHDDQRDVYAGNLSREEPQPGPAVASENAPRHTAASNGLHEPKSTEGNRRAAKDLAMDDPSLNSSPLIRSPMVQKPFAAQILRFAAAVMLLGVYGVLLVGSSDTPSGQESVSCILSCTPVPDLEATLDAALAPVDFTLPPSSNDEARRPPCRAC